MRLAHDLRCLRTNSYGFATHSLDAIGRMLGGWLRVESLDGIVARIRE